MGLRPEGLGRCVQWAITQRLLTSAGRSPGVHLFDEGLLQSLWSVGLRGDVTPTLRSLEQLDLTPRCVDVGHELALGGLRVEIPGHRSSDRLLGSQKSAADLRG